VVLLDSTSKILATELHIALDENFLPIEHPDDEAQIAEFEGTLDLVMIHSLTEAEIDDWKNYYQVILADTFQSKFYPLLLMCLNPSLERVKFVLEFVRYGASRAVEYTRKDWKMAPGDSRFIYYIWSQSFFLSSFR
jgi:hypothetical protein